MFSTAAAAAAALTTTTSGTAWVASALGKATIAPPT